MLTDLQKIGVGLTAFGIAFMVLGIILFFDAGFIAIGNILFLAGITIVIGFVRTILFFKRKQKIFGTVCFFTGIFLVFLKWPMIGIFIELFGFVNLFGDFFPVILSFMRNLPIIGNILNKPAVRRLTDRLVGKRLPV
ncbi:Got1-domain-containing protein [Anaeromyces robustus]|uniref:Got1-domain-containing protein n=1 Tax=Anaeromyces robustus TaxID=1754192 RepID=A0A1Y1X560_9FUNG|nr:Got1-domain-containing protein [Anaeromyces robustus]|eukprot:ORX80454.1 Got1-domain-containing protein [Anaeromyces robustus]